MNEAQVALDVSVAIDEAARVGIAHRDLSPINFGHLDGRGTLFDFSVGKVSATLATHIWAHGWRLAVQLFTSDNRDAEPSSPPTSMADLTGTSLYMAENVLAGESHTISTQLESLFLSLLDISCSHKLVGHNLLATAVSPLTCALARSGAMRCMHLPENDAITSDLRPFMRQLHQLFYPLVAGTRQRLHNEAVQAADLQYVCQQFINASVLTAMQLD
ncbi:hypothetical protein MMC07_005704 [Pseudocyphellaria aurata]|nr:hypothetical protein [Pseudocyphellaria aurata]